MKRYFLIIAVLFSLIGCQQATDPIDKLIPVDIPTQEENPEEPKPIPTVNEKPYFVKNSKWEPVDITTLVKASFSRSVSSLPSLNEAFIIVQKYNDSHDNDQLHLDTIDVPIEESPNVDIYYAKAVDGFYVIKEHYNVERSYFVQYRRGYDGDVATFGYVSFIDKVPETVPEPPPVVIDTRTRHEKYALYMVNKYDKIVVYDNYKYEQHIDELWDSLDAETQEGYKNDIDNLFNYRLSVFKSESVYSFYVDAPWRVVSGQIYIEPEPIIE